MASRLARYIVRRREDADRANMLAQARLRESLACLTVDPRYRTPVEARGGADGRRSRLSVILAHRVASQLRFWQDTWLERQFSALPTLRRYVWRTLASVAVAVVCIAIAGIWLTPLALHYSESESAWGVLAFLLMSAVILAILAMGAIAILRLPAEALIAIGVLISPDQPLAGSVLIGLPIAGRVLTEGWASRREKIHGLNHQTGEALDRMVAWLYAVGAVFLAVTIALPQWLTSLLVPLINRFHVADPLYVEVVVACCYVAGILKLADYVFARPIANQVVSDSCAERVAWPRFQQRQHLAAERRWALLTVAIAFLPAALRSTWAPFVGITAVSAGLFIPRMRQWLGGPIGNGQ